MIRVGITGQSGFVGTHLFNAFGMHPEKYIRIPFEDKFFEDVQKLQTFVKQCDVIVHLAAMMRSNIEGEVYGVNMQLTYKLIEAMDQAQVSPCILFSSSIQEGSQSEYGRCKKESRELFENWARSRNSGFIGLVFPNLYGPGARPNSHSFIATFCYKLNHAETPQVLVDNLVPLKYIKTLREELLSIVSEVYENNDIRTVVINPEFEIKVTEVLYILEGLKNGRKPNGYIEETLCETFESYKNYIIE